MRPRKRVLICSASETALSVMACVVDSKEGWRASKAQRPAEIARAAAGEWDCVVVLRSLEEKPTFRRAVNKLRGVPVVEVRHAVHVNLPSIHSTLLVGQASMAGVLEAVRRLSVMKRVPKPQSEQVAA